MKLLLDTHIWIWAATRPELLSRKVKRQLESPKNQLYLSPVSIWELSHLIRKGRVRLKRSQTATIEEMLSRIPAREAPFNFEVASRAAGIDLPQGDAGDIFIAATAVVFQLTLVTADAQLIECPWLETLPNL